LGVRNSHGASNRLKADSQLEERGHHPLRFFLKCLSNDDARLPQRIRQSPLVSCL
jgi:hypothetical protein